MTSRLLKSFLRVACVWWLVALILWSMSDARIGTAAGALAHQTITADARNAASLAVGVVRRWSLPVLCAALAAGIAGAGLAWGVQRLLWGRIKRRVRPGSEYRGLGISLGPLEAPVWAPDARLAFTAEVSRAVASRMKRLSAPQYALLNDILSYLAAHKDAYVGPGHQGSLLDHTLHVLERLPDKADDPLVLIGAAAHDAGKVQAWKRDDKGEWKRSGLHDDLGGLLLAAMPSAGLLPETEFRVLVTALRYAHKRERTPLLWDADERARVAAVQDAITAADHDATAREKKAVLREKDRPALLERAFLSALGDMQFQVAGLARGVKAAGWRKGARIFLSEPRLREVLQERLRQFDADAAAAWWERRQPARIAPQTADTMDMLRGKGWLVERIGEHHAHPAIWDIKSGTINLSGVLIVDLPEDLHHLLPKDAPYEITVIGPHFRPATARANDTARKPAAQDTPSKTVAATGKKSTAAAAMLATAGYAPAAPAQQPVNPQKQESST
ncbi:MAG: hypothetical protein QJR02_01820 [Sinobacteraceae bacterium]|nr:hypothetical protein [Nevskiaceae bacterium]